jgi:hypothetical protein
VRRLAPLASLLLLLAPEAHAQLSAGAGIEYFRWSEKTTPEVRESGPLFGVTLGLAPRRGTVRPAYRGHAGIGVAEYRGSFLFDPTVPANASTVFARMSHQAQVRVRARPDLEGVAALSYDFWHRQLSAQQAEDYQLLSLLLGIERDDPERPGPRVAVGMRIPLAIREDAHLDRLGYASNPTLEPRPSAGPFGEIGYRFGPRLSLVGAVDSFHLEESDPVTLRGPRGSTSTVRQPESSVLMLRVRLEYTR